MTNVHEFQVIENVSELMKKLTESVKENRVDISDIDPEMLITVKIIGLEIHIDPTDLLIDLSCK